MPETWEGEVPSTLPFPDQDRDALEAALIAEVGPAVNTFIADLIEYLIGQQRDNAATPTPVGVVAAGGAFDPLAGVVNQLWAAALKTSLPPGTAQAFNTALPNSIHDVVRDVVTNWQTVAHRKTQETLRRELQKSFRGPTRAFVENLSRTEATQRWNERYLRESRNRLNLQKLAGSDQPTFKRWVSRHDDRVRHDHLAADGQVVFINEPFMVGGYPLKHPGDPSAPPAQVRNCRCVMEIFQSQEADSMKLLLASGAQGATWHGSLVFEGEMTGDGRLIEPDALYWDEGGCALRSVEQDTGAHDGAVVVGRIDTMTRNGDAIDATGVLDLGAEAGREARRRMAAGFYNGVSVDLDDVSFEIRVRSELLNGDPIASGEGGEEGMAAPRVDEDGRETVLDISSDDEVMVIKRARIRAATLVAIPAFANARIDLDDPLEEGEETAPAPGSAEAAAAADQAEPFVIVASANDDAPPASWFENPGLTRETPLTVTADGRVFGHIATWRTEHIARPGTTPPRSQSDYRYFHTGAVLADDGREIAVGRLTVGTGHADDDAPPLRAMAHYDNTGNSVAYVRAGEDAHGIWVAGCVRPTASGAQLQELRAHPPSGDWRRIGGALELVAVLCVNTPGFPVPRGLVASGHMQTFIAATGPRPDPSAGVIVPPENMARMAEMVETLAAEAEGRRRRVMSKAKRVRNQLTLARARRVAANLNREDN